MWEKITRAAHVTMQCREGGGERRKKFKRSRCVSFSRHTIHPHYYVCMVVVSSHDTRKVFIFCFFFFLNFFMIPVRIFFHIYFYDCYSLAAFPRDFFSLSLCVCVIHYGKLVRETIWLLIMCSIFLGSFFIELMGRHVKNPLARSHQLSSAFWYSSILLLESIAVPLF